MELNLNVEQKQFGIRYVFIIVTKSKNIIMEQLFDIFDTFEIYFSKTTNHYYLTKSIRGSEEPAYYVELDPNLPDGFSIEYYILDLCGIQHLKIIASTDKELGLPPLNLYLNRRVTFP